MNTAKTKPGSKGDWRYLGHEIWRRTWGPFSNVPFVFYVVLAILCLGGLGIWVELVKTALDSPPKNFDGVLTALSTFFPALIGSASLQLILASTGNSDKVLVSFALLACFVSFFGVVLIRASPTYFHRRGFGLSRRWLGSHIEGVVAPKVEGI